MGQPRSSKSTGTCSAIGVESLSVLMNCGVAYTTRINSSTSFQFRSAWMPPAVAQAPMATSVLHCRLRIRRELVEIDASFKPKLANTLNNLANACYSKGLLDDAVEYYKEALKIRRELVEQDYTLQFATSLILLGIALATRGSEEDKLSSKKLQNEAESLLQNPVVVGSSRYYDLETLAEILNSLVGE